MRILYWTELFWPYIGGIQVLASHTLEALRRRGHEVTVVTCHTSSDWPARSTTMAAFPSTALPCARRWHGTTSTSSLPWFDASSI